MNVGSLERSAEIGDATPAGGPAVHSARRVVVATLLSGVIPWLLSTDAFSSDADRVAPSAEEVQPVAVGQQAPPVVFRDLDGREVALAGLWGEKPVVLIFYRGGW
jgi:cytochrome oxidase Cu insertion factor (SCO1/SenC/PrrC family)